MGTAPNMVQSQAKLHPLADRVLKTRNEVARVERLLNNAKFELEQFGPNADKLQLEITSARILEQRRAKVRELIEEHRKACGLRDAAQRDYEKFPVVAETLAGLKAFHEEAGAAIKAGTDLNKILETQDALKKLGLNYETFIAGRDTVHAQGQLLSVKESFTGEKAACSWMRTFEYEERCRKLLGKIL